MYMHTYHYYKVTFFDFAVSLGERGEICRHRFRTPLEVESEPERMSNMFVIYIYIYIYIHTYNV